VDYAVFEVLGQKVQEMNWERAAGFDLGL